MTSDKPPAIEDTANPRRRMIGNIVLVAFSVYVVMIYVLALDQQFHWGLFPP